MLSRFPAFPLARTVLYQPALVVMANLAASVNTSASDGGLKECLRLGNVPQGVIDDLTDPNSADSLRTLKNLLYYPHSEADPMPCLLNLLVGCRGYEDKT